RHLPGQVGDLERCAGGADHRDDAGADLHPRDHHRGCAPAAAGPARRNGGPPMTDTPATGGRCPRASRADDRLTVLAMAPGLGLVQPAPTADRPQRPAHRNEGLPMTRTPFAAAGTARHKHTTRGDDRLTVLVMAP